MFRISRSELRNNLTSKFMFGGKISVVSQNYPLAQTDVVVISSHTSCLQSRTFWKCCYATFISGQLVNIFNNIVDICMKAVVDN